MRKMNKILEVKKLNFSFGEKKVLKNINIELYEGEIVSIVGISGSGKTTLFNIIAGILKKQEGEILINSSKNYVGNVSYMLQKDLLLEHKTIIENIILPLIIGGENKKKAFEEARVILKKFDLLEYSDKYPKQLSGGMRQRIALIRTYLFKRKIFLLDEAFSALDAFTKINLHNWYLKVSKELNFTTLLITHDIDEAIKLSSRIYILSSTGEIIKEIKVKIKNDTDEDYQKLIYKKEILKSMGIN